MAKYTIITTCKGRLDYLLRTLPSYVAQDDTQVVVVDYDCPQKTADIVLERFTGVTVKRVSDQPKFNASHARNLGASIATGQILIFVDCDIVLRDDFTTQLAKFPADHYGEFFGPNDVRGSCVVSASAFHRVSGYDEVIMGYGGEDLDLYGRLRLSGLTAHALDMDYIVEIIPNSIQERINFSDAGRKLGFARGSVYRELKLILLRLENRLELDIRLRRELWKNIDALVKSPDIFDHEHFLDVPLPPISTGGFLANCSVGASIRMSVKLGK